MNSSVDHLLAEHNWFAWYPVVTYNYAPGQIVVRRVWLATVKRKLVTQPSGVFAWAYRM